VGKSIPVEKLAAREARKYAIQGGKLLLPVFELGYVSLMFPRVLRDALINVKPPRIEGEQELRRCQGK
jgi:hypothetical protein